MTSDALQLDITVEAETWTEALPEDEAVARQATLVEGNKAGSTGRPTEVSIVLGDDAMVRRLNDA